MTKTIDIIEKRTEEVVVSYTENFKTMEFLTMTEAYDEGSDIDDYDDSTVFFRIVFVDGNTVTFPCQEYKVAFN